MQMACGPIFTLEDVAPGLAWSRSASFSTISKFFRSVILLRPRPLAKASQAASLGDTKLEDGLYPV